MNEQQQAQFQKRAAEVARHEYLSGAAQAPTPAPKKKGAKK